MEHKGGCHCGNLRLRLSLSRAPEETALRACGWDAGRCAFNSFHIMGSARMGGCT